MRFEQYYYREDDLRKPGRANARGLNKMNTLTLALLKLKRITSVIGEPRLV